MDNTDFMILRAISDLKVPYPKVAKINSLVSLDLEELGARLGVLEMQGFIETQSDACMDGPCLPNGVCAARLTNLGRRALSGQRW